MQYTRRNAIASLAAVPRVLYEYPETVESISSFVHVWLSLAETWKTSPLPESQYPPSMKVSLYPGSDLAVPCSWPQKDVRESPFASKQDKMVFAEEGYAGAPYDAFINSLKTVVFESGRKGLR